MQNTSTDSSAPKKSKGFLSFGHFAILLLLVILVLISAFSLEKQNIDVRQENNLKAGVLEASRFVAMNVNSVSEDILSISKSSLVKEFLESDKPTRRDELRHLLESDFFYLVHQHRYAQLRILDLDGLEKIRVDHFNNQTYIIPQDNLQDKSNRYYYRDSLLIQSGQIYQSILDLNVENGQVETPWNPMIRMVSPVFIGGKKLGFVVINFSAKQMFQSMQKIADSHDITLTMLNKNGYYLFDSYGDKSLWGFMFNNPESSMKHTNNELWNDIRFLKAPMLMSDEGRPLYATKVCSLGCEVATGMPILYSNANDIPWYILAAEKPKNEEAGIFDNVWLIVIIVALLLIIFIASDLSIALRRSLVKSQRNAERLQVELAVLERLFSHIPDGILLTDNRGTITKLNHEVEKIFEKNSADIIGQRVEMFMPEALRSRHTAYMDMFMREPKVIAVTRGNPFIYVTEHGDEKSLEVIVAPIPSGDTMKVLVLVRDVTKSIELERKVIQQHRFDAVGSFMNTLARDYSVHLQVILSNVYAAGLHIDKKNIIYPRFREIEQAANRANELTEKLVSIAHQRRIDLQCVALNKLLGDNEQFIKRCLDDSVELVVKRPDEHLGILVDPVEFDNLMMQLAVNSKESMGEMGGMIDISVETVVLSRGHDFVESGELSAGQYVQISVKDNGQGISETEIGKVFDPFYTTKSNHTGLGLTSVFNLMRFCKGHVSITSQVGKGTAVTLYFHPCDVYLKA